MKIIGLAMTAAVVMTAPTALRAADVKAAQPPAVSTGTQAAVPQGLVRGYRGTTLSVGGDQLLYIKKGDRVDVLVTFDAKKVDKDKKEYKEKTTSTILQNVVVINVSKPDKTEGTGAIELLLNPVEAQYAALSVTQAKSLSLVVRAAGDTELHPMEMASFRKLIK